jgi:hypothetical protein
MTPAPEPSIHPLSREAWREWLGENHHRKTGVWLVSYKKATCKPRFDYDAAVEEALCFGWIDSKPNKLDAERTLLWFAPRKPGTGWSRPNKLRIETMTAAGLMRRRPKPAPGGSTTLPALPVRTNGPTNGVPRQAARSGDFACAGVEIRWKACDGSPVQTHE